MANAYHPVADMSLLPCPARHWPKKISCFPQVNREDYAGPEADLWSCQIVLITMLAGCT